MAYQVSTIRLTDWGFTEPAPDIGDGDSNFKRILLAVTDSAPCTRALAVAAGIARASRSQVYVVHLIERLFLGRAGWCAIETPDEAKTLVVRFRIELEKLGVRASAVTGKSRRDQIAARIVSAATELGVDTIVIGTRRRSAIRALLSGSVSHEIVRKSKIPVVVVP
ncbi:MAG TPA: universal stress protein [Candidatus Dormibacteraeota bacterium]